MSSPCPRIVRCRVRDLASCFYACRLPLEQEPDNSCAKSPQFSAHRRTVMDPKSMGLAHKAKTEMPKKVGEGRLVDELHLSGDSSRGRVKGLEPRFAEEDYIVFCFREDGEIDMINNEPSEAYYDSGNANRNKGDETVKKSNHNIVKEMGSVGQPNSASKMESFESCDSNLSDTTSTSSFAFPVLGLDWIGSPVHMPVSEKPNCASCCSF